MAFGKNSADQAKRKVQHEEQKVQIRERLRHIKHKILVMSGKGGVGKSCVAAYLAVSLAKRNYDVGLLDVDLHGPSIPRILGLTGVIQPGKTSKTISPLKYLPNMDVVSIETLVKDRDAAMIWRGPLKGGVIRQFVADVDWNDLDYLIIDSPPGTGDEPLTVAQTIPDAKALIVTTPQELSLADVRKSINFCRQVHMEILGLVENMSGLQCPYCGKIIDVFKRHGGRLTAANEKLRLLATLPLVPEVVIKGDSGDMSLLENRDHAITQAFNNLVDKILTLNAHGKVSIIEPAA